MRQFIHDYGLYITGSLLLTMVLRRAFPEATDADRRERALRELER